MCLNENVEWSNTSVPCTVETWTLQGIWNWIGFINKIWTSLVVKGFCKSCKSLTYLFYINDPMLKQTHSVSHYVTLQKAVADRKN